MYEYKYPRPSVTADCIVFGTVDGNIKVLLIRRGHEPFSGCWAFPGGFMNMDETAGQAAVRELKEETGLEVNQVTQLGAYSAVDRDPRGRTVTVAYIAVIEGTPLVAGDDDATAAKWFDISEGGEALPPLAFDHREILADAIKKLPTLLAPGTLGRKILSSCKQ